MLLSVDEHLFVQLDFISTYPAMYVYNFFGYFVLLSDVPANISH